MSLNIAWFIKKRLLQFCSKSKWHSFVMLIENSAAPTSSIGQPQSHGIRKTIPQKTLGYRWICVYVCGGCGTHSVDLDKRKNLKMIAKSLSLSFCVRNFIWQFQYLNSVKLSASQYFYDAFGLNSFIKLNWYPPAI